MITNKTTFDYKKIIKNVSETSQNIEIEKNDGNKLDKIYIPKKYKLLIIIFCLLAASYTVFEITKEREAKKTKEIERILNKSFNDKTCEQYALVASVSGYYPCYQTECENLIIWLNAGEVWKYGKTCNGEDGRYLSSYLMEMKLFYRQQFVGNEKECLIIEKQKIYSYPNLPECLIRKIILLRPPGNKIDR